MSDNTTSVTLTWWHLLPAFGRHKLDEITLREVEGYKARKLATGLSPKSVNNHFIILRKLLWSLWTGSCSRSYRR